MTVTEQAPGQGQERRSAAAGQATVRLAVIDSDTGFLQVLGKRLEDGLAAPCARLAGAAGCDGRAAVERGRDRSGGAGPAGLELPRQALRSFAGVGRDRVHGAVLGRPACARAAARRRRLGQQALPSGGADRPHRGRRPAPQARRRARREGAGLDRRGRDPRGPVPGVRGRCVGRADPARVRAHPVARRGRGPGPAARGDLSAGLGLRHGPRGSFGGGLRAQAAFETGEGLAFMALHPHALRDRVPLRGGAGRGGGGRVDPGARARARRGCCAVADHVAVAAAEAEPEFVPAH